MVCGVRVEEIEDPLMREIRYLDKLIDELAKGKADGEDPAQGLSPPPAPPLRSGEEGEGL